MSPAWVRARQVTVSKRNPRGRTYQVLYRRGGRAHKIEYAGTFKTERDAKLRRDLVAGWLAQGLNPKAELEKLQAPAPLAKSPVAWQEEWLLSRHDIAPKTAKLYRNGLNAILKLLDTDDLSTVTVTDCERVVALLVARYAPSTVATYWKGFTQLLDYAMLDPNPARDRRVRMPRQRKKPPTPPTAEHLAAMLGRLQAKYVLPAVTIEQTAIRVESVELLTWGVVDVAGCRLRIFEKGQKYRWVGVPRWLMRQLEATCPLEDRLPDRSLFPGVKSEGLRQAMGRACRLAKVPHYHPHDLRHRRASLWHLSGIPDAVLAERVGHERSSFTKDVYVHVMPVAEIPDERLEAIVVEAARS